MHFHVVMCWTHKCKRGKSKPLQIFLSNHFVFHWVYGKVYLNLPSEYGGPKYCTLEVWHFMITIWKSWKHINAFRVALIKKIEKLNVSST